MTKTISTLTLVSALFLGSASAHAGEGARGQVSVDGPAVKAVTVGPTSIHAYSGFSGGAMYTALAVTGTDADCQTPVAGRTTVDLKADVVVAFSVPAGQIACLTTTGNLEVVWHAKAPSATDAPTTMIARR